MMGQAALTHSSSTGLWLSGHQQGPYSQPHLSSLSHPVGNLQGISGKKCSPEPVETKQPRGFLLPQGIFHHLMEYHTLGKNTLSPSHSPATLVHPQPFLAPSTTFPIPTKEPFFTAQGCLQTIRHHRGWQGNHTHEGRASLTQMILIF